MKEVGFDKKAVLNIRHAFLVVQASMELKAEQLVAQNLVPASSGNMVPQLIRTLAPISELRLDAVSLAASRRATASTSTVSRSSAAWGVVPSQTGRHHLGFRESRS